MKAAIYNPYWDTLGGGERYTASFVQALIEKNYKVDIESDKTTLKNELKNRFGLDLGQVQIVESIKRGEGYDLVFWLSDGSIPLLRAKNNILHFQFPFTHVNGNSLMNRMKLFRISSIICNSYFTKSFIDKEYGVESEVIYPPVETSQFKPKKKEKIIIYVGRFSKLTQAKRQDVLVECFKKLVDDGLNNWKLYLVGGAEVGGKEYLTELRQAAKGYPVEFVESPSYKELLGIYAKAKIFWSAAGYGVDEKKEPKKVEHFGITVVEAMASGAVPLVYNAGGHKEIICEGRNGYLWDTKGSLISATQELINNKKQLKSMTNKAKEDSKIYELNRFSAQVESLL